MWWFLEGRRHVKGWLVVGLGCGGGGVGLQMVGLLVRQRALGGFLRARLYVHGLVHSRARGLRPSSVQLWDAGPRLRWNAAPGLRWHRRAMVPSWTMLNGGLSGPSGVQLGNALAGLRWR